MQTTSSERRLHPISLVFTLGRTLSRMALPLLVLLLANREAAPYLSALIGGVFAVAALIAVVEYLRYSYRYDAAELVIRSGLFTRNERSIPYSRIQNLDAAQNLLHRLFGVTVVHVQTGGGAEPEASLRVLPVTALHEMRERVLAAGGRARGPQPTSPASPPVTSPASSAGSLPASSPATSPSPASPPASPELTSQPRTSRTLLALGARDLVLAGFIENRGMVLILGALALLEQGGVIRMVIERLFEAEDAALTGLAARWLGDSDVPMVQGALLVTAALLAILLFIRLLSTVWAVVRLYDFRLDRTGDDLQMEYGLFTRVSATIPLRRVQTIVVTDGVLHRMLGRCAVVVETAGGAAIEMAQAREPIAPILRVEQLPALLHELQPGFDPAVIEWQRVHSRAFGRMFRASLFGPVMLSLLALYFVQEWAVAVLALLVGYAFVHARLRARHLAWSLTRDSVAVRDGAFTRAVRIARFSRVQVVALHRNPFDVRTGMARLRADTAGARTGVVVPYLATEVAAALRLDLTARTEVTSFTW